MKPFVLLFCATASAGLCSPTEMTNSTPEKANEPACACVESANGLPAQESMAIKGRTSSNADAKRDAAKQKRRPYTVHPRAHLWLT